MNDQPQLQFDVAYPERLSRLLIFVKWLLAIPHFIVLYLLGIALSFTTFISFFAILILGRYPRGLWDFGLMVMRWQARVIAYVGLLRDEYPPFGDSDYPVLFHLDYPERLSRWKIFVKWLLIIPHAIVLYFLYLLAGIVYFISWFAILFTGRFPRGMFDFIVGFLRWLFRVNVYVYMFTDAYPPFSMGNTTEPPTLYQPAAYAQGALPPRAY